MSTAGTICCYLFGFLIAKVAMMNSVRVVALGKPVSSSDKLIKISKGCAVLGMLTSGLVLATNILTLTNFQDFNDLRLINLDLVDVNSGFVYYGIVGGAISFILCVVLVIINKNQSSHRFYMVL